MNFSSAEENYLKAIYHLQLEQDTVTTNALAEKLNTRAASVTDMMKKLSAKKLLHYRPYYGFYLSAEGKQTALYIIRRHRLWEYFLAQKLGFGWDEVHLLAEELEHVSSKKLIDKLEEYLDFPKFDPHGDPIPDSKGKIQPIAKTGLLEAPLQQAMKVVMVSNQSPEMLELLQHKNIQIGTIVEVKKHLPFDRSMEVKVNRTKMITVSELLAKNIFVAHEKHRKL